MVRRQRKLYPGFVQIRRRRCHLEDGQSFLSCSRSRLHELRNKLADIRLIRHRSHYLSLTGLDE